MRGRVKPGRVSPGVKGKIVEHNTIKINIIGTII
jgi:hypothetical protein